MARSSVSIAIFTPAQNPRGLARMIFIEPVDLMVLIRGCLGEDIRYHNVQSTMRIEKHTTIKLLWRMPRFLANFHFTVRQPLRAESLRSPRRRHIAADWQAA